MTNANYWSLIQNEAGERFACQRQVDQAYETERGIRQPQQPHSSWTN
ncbi:hypothetical protein [Burkholderia mayonis]|nr:hypothetical protein [Burkholderia mayonis]